MSKSNDHSRQILAYWTAERMQSAQPEPDPEFAMTSTERAQAILDYWAPERLAAALPEEHAYGEHIEGDAEEELMARTGAQRARVAGSLKIVPDENVKKFPYQSVGKLFYTKVSPSGSRDSYASAWVANMSTLLHVVCTAAHNLKKGNEHAENILFIPGFIPPNTKPFGSYPQIPGGEGTAWRVDPKWNPNAMQPGCDQALVKLDKDAVTGKYVDEEVIPISILSNQQYSSTSAWNTIGFPVPSSQNPNGKMCERSGTYYRTKDNAVYKYGTLPQGTSGGPWILAGSDDSSNGLQAGNRDDIGCTLSPYFRSSAEELIRYFKFQS